MPRPTLAHRLEYLAYRGVERLTSWLSMESCTVLGRVLGRAFQFLSPRYRRLVRRNLRIATAGQAPDAATLDHLVTETFRRAGANFLGSLRSGTMSPAALARHVEFEPRHLIEPPPNGLLVALPHMGNWEVLAKIGTLHAPAAGVGAVYRPLDNPLTDALTLQRRSADGARLFSRKDGFHPPTALLRAGGTLGVLSDQRAGGRGSPLPFFGKLTTCTPLPALMARRAKAEVRTLATRGAGDGRWIAELESLGTAPALDSIMRSLEGRMHRSLPDVFWFHDRWRTDSGRPLSFYTAIDPDVAARCTVPLRLALTLPADARPHAPALIETLLAHRPDLRLDWLGGVAHADPRVVVVDDYEPDAPAGQLDGLLRRVDAAHPAPLDGALLFDGHPALARAARRLGLRAVIGLEVAGRTWSRSLPRPADEAGWIALAEELARHPKSRQR